MASMHHYTDSNQGPSGGGRGIMFGMPRPGAMVKRLLIINCVVFVVQMFSDRSGEVSMLFGASAAGWWQVWRYVTFQFLHADFWHVGLNMLGLYMLGTPLEQAWGGRRFLRFYLGCGAFSGVVYVIASVLWGQGWVPLIGASGGVFAILLAAAVLFPHFKLILFIFPTPIRFAAVLVFGMMTLTVLQGITSDAMSANVWSAICHLGGALAAAAYLFVLPKLKHLPDRQHDDAPAKGKGAWARKIAAERKFQAQLDEVLAKVHREGIGNLTNRDRKLLKEATERERQARQ